MEILHPGKPPKIVRDYDFTLVHGAFLPITIDESAGDTIDFGETQVKVHVSQKESPMDPSAILPAEDVVIYLDKVIAYQTREREVIQLNQEQQDEWKRAFNKGSSRTH